ncbi:MAG: hypothetical protein WA070_18100 [Sphingobium sp.]
MICPTRVNLSARDRPIAAQRAGDSNPHRKSKAFSPIGRLESGKRRMDVKDGTWRQWGGKDVAASARWPCSR